MTDRQHIIDAMKAEIGVAGCCYIQEESEAAADVAERLIAEAVQAERDRCAKIVRAEHNKRKHDLDSSGRLACRCILAAIEGVTE